MLYSCITASGSPLISKCVMGVGSPVDLQTWLQVQTAFAAVHLVFAPYFQYKVWKSVVQKMRESPDLLVDNTIPSLVIYDSFREVFLHDLGILFYAVVLVASYIWSWKGSDWVNDGSSRQYCDPGGESTHASYFGRCFFWVAVLYNFSYYYCGCCASSVQLRQPAEELGYAAPGVEMMK